MPPPDVFEYLKSWENRWTARQPTPEEWPAFRVRLLAVQALAAEVEEHLREVYYVLPPNP